jgi:DNA repair photolyase
VIEVKSNLVRLLKKELERGNKGVYGIGTVTDPYQPVERERELTRGCLRELRARDARVSILTKSDLVLRDLDLLSGWKTAEVGMSIAMASEELASVVEPLAPSPRRRIAALERLAREGISTYLMAAPIIKDIGDAEDQIRELVGLAHRSGVQRIIWDVYNPKPMARIRLSSALAGLGKDLAVHSRSEARCLGDLFRRECARYGIEVEDAF